MARGRQLICPTLQTLVKIINKLRLLDTNQLRANVDLISSFHLGRDVVRIIVLY